MTETVNDPYVERYYKLRKVALAKGLDLRYSRRRANIVDVLLGEVECEGGALTGEERLHLLSSDDGSLIWASSVADAATVFQETTDYLESGNSDDPGSARAAYGREESQRLVEQIVVWAKEFVGAANEKEEP